jgi:hypothetical protein
MLQKPPRRAAAPANADAADQSINRLKPFADTLAKKLAGSAKARRKLSSRFLVALDAWSCEIRHDKTIATCNALKKTRDCMIALSKQCDETVRATLSSGWIQDQDLVNKILSPPSPNPIADLATSLPSCIKTMEAWVEKYRRTTAIEPKPGNKPSRGRPSGVTGYPNLETLVFLLEGHSAFHGAFLTAYIKKNGELKVAAGSLIDALNMLRSYLMNDPVYSWLANSLPLPGEHLTYVSTYQRILADARIEAGDQQVAHVKNPAGAEF